MEKIVYSNKQIKVFYNEDNKILTTNYSGMMNFELAMDHFAHVEEFSKTNSIAGIVGDLRKLRGSFIRVLDHFENNGYPILIKNGLKAEAIIVSDDLITAHLAEMVQELLIKMGLRCEIFTSPEEGKKWLADFLNNSN